eukprot:TRINITY_DN64483_c0_g1_i1.p1 TRINITY_DN64483_c0_g1~~TRINITY_DN64483_c0_g1_i1.p1  ORF type:complete len:325 (-),score=50.67 TRINITY_DN64483_c0_g1_i1:136-1110(-)
MKLRNAHAIGLSIFCMYSIAMLLASRTRSKLVHDIFVPYRPCGFSEEGSDSAVKASIATPSSSMLHTAAGLGNRSLVDQSHSSTLSSKLLATSSKNAVEGIKERIFSMLTACPAPLVVGGLAAASPVDEDAVMLALTKLGVNNPTADPVHSDDLVGRWKLMLRSGRRVVPRHLEHVLADIEFKLVESVFFNIRKDRSVYVEIVVLLNDGKKTRTVSFPSLLIARGSSMMIEGAYAPAWIKERELLITYVDQNVLIWHASDSGSAAETDDFGSAGVAEMFIRQDMSQREKYVQERLDALYEDGLVTVETVDAWRAQLWIEWENQH